MITFKMAPERFLPIARFVAPLVDDFTINFEEGLGFRVSVVDPAHVAMATVVVPEPSIKGSGAWAFDADDIKDAMKALPESRLDVKALAAFKITDDGLLRIELDGAVFEVASLQAIHASSQSSKKSPEEFIGPQEPKVPRFVNQAQFTAPLRRIGAACRGVAGVADHLRLTLNAAKKAATVDADSERRTVEWDLRATDVMLPAREGVRREPGKATALYSLDYLNGIFGVWMEQTNVDSGQPAKILFDTDCPMSIEVEVQAGPHKGLKTMHMLAPRIES